MKHSSQICTLIIAASAADVTLAKDAADGSKASYLEEVLVVGKPIENYRATDALTGSKTGALLKDLPVSVSVVPQQLIEDRGISYLGEALDNVSGAQRLLGYGGTQNFGAYLRGFNAGYVTLRNGFRDYGFYTMRDSANVERFEVLKGPGSILYGSMQPGGITNTLTKQPLPTAAHDATLIVGGDDYYRGEIDSGGPLSERVFYRLNLAYEDGGKFRDEVENRSWFVAPVISWLISDRTHWTGELEYKKSEFTWDLGLPRDPRVLDVPVSRFLGETDRLNEVESLLVSSVLEHDFNDTWSLRQRAQYSKAGGDYFLRSPLFIQADGRSVFRVAYTSPGESENYNLQHELVGNLSAFGMRHQAVFGIEWYRNKDTSDFIFEPLASIDLYEPVYGAVPGAGFPLFGNEITNDAWAAYFQDLISLSEQWKLLVGVRYDSVNTKDFERVRQVERRDSDDSAVTPQIGLTYQPTPSTSLYASYSTSFTPIVNGTTITGDFLDPEEGEQLEIGLKQELLGGKLSATLAAYWITKENVSNPDLQNPGFRVQVGEQKSRGVELDVAGQLLPGWDIIFGGAYNDAYVSRDNVRPVGTQLDNAPEWSGNLWTKYSVRDGVLRGLSFGGGANYASERPVTSFAGVPNFELPSYVRLDAMIGWTQDRWSLRLNGKNLTDKRIYDLTGTTIMPQESRTWVLNATVKL